MPSGTLDPNISNKIKDQLQKMIKMNNDLTGLLRAIKLYCEEIETNNINDLYCFAFYIYFIINNKNIQTLTAGSIEENNIKSDNKLLTQYNDFKANTLDSQY